MFDRQNIALQLFSKKILSSRIGVLARGFRGIDPRQMIIDLSMLQNTPSHIYAAIVGYDTQEEETEAYTISSTIEKAVLWRSMPELAGKIVVLIKDDADKLHSLAEFDELTMSDISLFMIQLKLESATNEPTKAFWAYLKEEASFFSVEAVENYINAVDENSNDALAISKCLWHLNLLRDDELLSTKYKAANRIRENRELIYAVTQLSAEATKRLSRSLASIKRTNQDALKVAYRNLQDYIRYGKESALMRLDFATVKSLLKSSQKDIIPPQPDDPTPPPPPDDNINVKQARQKISEMLFSDSPEDDEALTGLLEKIREHLSSDDSGNYITDVPGSLSGKKIECSSNKNALRTLVGKTCTEQAWGALVTTEVATLKEAISNYSTCVPIMPRDPDDAFSAFDGVPLFNFIESFDQLFKKSGYSSTISFTPIISKLQQYRQQLLENLDILMYYPILALKKDDALYNALFAYVDAWKELFHAYRENYHALTSISPTGGKFIAKELLALDTVFIKTPKEWKAFLLPLHPVYLWRYSEVLKVWREEEASLGQEDKDALKEALLSLPQVLNIVIASDVITHEGNHPLPCSGSIDMLPTFENKTNRYIGEDGIESVQEVLTRWLGFAPYTKNEIRICTVDIPGIPDVIRSVKDFLDKTDCKRVVMDIYMTRDQNGNDELAHLDFTGRDHALSTAIRNGSIVLSLHHVSGPAEVKKSLAKKPVHVAFFFDQSSYQIETAPAQKNLYITPLVVTYDYSLDKATHRGTISPSSDTNSGLIGDYHRVMEFADVVMSDMNIRTTYNNTPEVNQIVSTIEDGNVQWLVVADRSTSYYVPANSIPIGEKQYDRRIVSTWASNSSRIISDYITELCKYNLYPSKEVVADILSRFGHIASCGLISIPKYSTSSKAIENMKKGLLGTLFAAVKYTNDYKDQNPLVASLDTASAKNWLYDSRFGNERADLIGMRYDATSNTLYVQPIEVKTRDDSPDATPVYDSKDDITYIEGHAADQIAAVSNLLKEIFGLTDAESHTMFISARREVLKYQIVSECFRKTHAPESQEEWEQVFRRAFANGKTGNIKIQVSGILYHFKLSDSTPGSSIDCVHKNGNSECRIVFETMTTPAIQQQIFGERKNDTQITPEFTEDNGQAIDIQSEDLVDIPHNLEDIHPSVEENTNSDMEKPQESKCENTKSDTDSGPHHNVTQIGAVQDLRVLLGKDIHTGEPYFWEFGNKNLNNRHLLINGNSGCGKTYCIEALLMEVALQGVSAVVFDYTGGFTNSKLDPIFREKLSSNLTQRIIKRDRIPIDPFKKNITQIDEDEFIPETNVDVATRIAEIFSTVYSLGDQQRSAVYSAVCNGLASHGAQMSFEIMANELENIGSTYAKSVLSKIQPFIDLAPFSSDSQFDWGAIRDTREGQVYVMQLSGYARSVQLLLTELMLWDIWYYCVQTGDETKPFVVVLDEAQNLNHGENSPSAKILTEGRKFGISGWYATQFMKPQLTDDEIQRLQQSGQKLYFCPPDDGTITVAKNIDISSQGAKEWAARLKKLKKGEAVTCGNMIRNTRWTRYDPKIIKITSLDERIIRSSKEDQ